MSRNRHQERERVLCFLQATKEEKHPASRQVIQEPGSEESRFTMMGMGIRKTNSLCAFYVKDEPGYWKRILPFEHAVLVKNKSPDTTEENSSPL
ncbi:hypothetical protein Nepgr_024812 [Nepenthes gracilis]|uniref:Uncharacterized protein n=1 Tax=Nepenthes gracilis TaxID=150966 RepID=A0AAD3T5T6_NEPGR|nr:hypothetical protein Nepgr_024812 [Nepenthes gracilis]